MRSYPFRVTRRALPRGMSLLECVVALGILAIAAVMFSSSTLSGIAAQEDSMALTMAVAAGEGKMSEFLARDWDDLAVGTVSEVAGGLVDPDGNLLPSTLQGFNRETVTWASTLTVPGYDGLGVEGMNCTVTVSDTFNGQTRTLCVLERFRPQTVTEGAEVGEGDDAPGNNGVGGGNANGNGNGNGNGNN